MHKKIVLIIAIFSFILIFSSSILALELEGELNSTFIKNGESELKPILESNLFIKNLHNEFGIGLKTVYSDQNFSFYDIFSSFNLNLVEKYKTNLIIGLSQYNGFKMEEEYRGFLLGSNIEKRVGGRAGGGSELTKKGRKLMNDFLSFRREIHGHIIELEDKYFNDWKK